MKKIMLDIGKLFIGLFICAVGIVMMINANLGLAPWDVFHQGISKITGLTMGRAHIIVGLILLIVDSILGEKIGWGTLCNMLSIGIFMDLLMLNNIIPIFAGFVPSFIMMLLGSFIMAYGSYLYISVGLGSGPRDGLVVGLTKKTGKSVRLIKNSVEITALVIGYILGGTVGIGTFVMALTGGYFLQLAFKIGKFDVNEAKHRFIDEDIKLVKSRLIDEKSDAS